MGERQDNIGLPPKPFLYTLDQVAGLLGTSEKNLKMRHIYFEGRSTGRPPPSKLRVVNIEADPTHRPDWRCSEQELIRWMRSKGFRYHTRGWIE